ncbi:hypothetical protein F3J14_23920 [Burkholderia sp. Tr-862]|nr:hypothetical protein [Burkholderia sp. Tr-862]
MSAQRCDRVGHCCCAYAVADHLHAPPRPAQALLGHASIDTTEGRAKTVLPQLRASVDRMR